MNATTPTHTRTQTLTTHARSTKNGDLPNAAVEAQNQGVQAAAEETATALSTNATNTLNNVGATASGPFAKASMPGSAGEVESIEPAESAEDDLSIAPTAVGGLMAPLTTSE